MAARKTEDDLIHARIYREQKRLLSDLARQRGMTLSSVVRSLAEEAVEGMAA